MVLTASPVRPGKVADRVEPVAVPTPPLRLRLLETQAPSSCQHDANHPQVRPLGITGFPGNVIVLLATTRRPHPHLTCATPPRRPAAPPL